MASTEGTISLPKQHVKKGRGVPGYKGANIEIVDRSGKVVGKGQTDTKAKKAARQQTALADEDAAEKKSDKKS